MASVAIVSLLLIASQFIPHHQPIVEENHPAYSYPYLHEQVPAWAVFVLAVLSWALATSLSALVWKDRTDCIRCSMVFVLGVSLTFLVTHLVKIAAGKPRPNYFNNPNKSDRGLSFPSGHSSVSMAFCHLQYLWFQWRLSQLKVCRQFRFETAMLCALPHALAGWISITRVQDFWHDYVDVTAGALIGVAIARFVFSSHYSKKGDRAVDEGGMTPVPECEDDHDGSGVLKIQS